MYSCCIKHSEKSGSCVGIKVPKEFRDSHNKVNSYVIPPSFGSKHPKPMMEENKSVSVSDLEQILSGKHGIMQLPSRAMDEVYPGIYIGEQ
ncbi:hypothetical protein EB796_000155 [Bugula neritina]|uniref:Uncharacterized protein n=1 Tax=Bugula neritina TaxID=10212 RepID=A0A7J7KTJ4_BUGNE|nr:hypothetical protein EB796_000155 [Bugula neritina]